MLIWIEPLFNILNTLLIMESYKPLWVINCHWRLCGSKYCTMFKWARWKFWLCHGKLLLAYLLLRQNDVLPKQNLPCSVNQPIPDVGLPFPPNELSIIRPHHIKHGEQHIEIPLGKVTTINYQMKQPPHRFSAIGSLLFMRYVSFTFTDCF